MNFKYRLALIIMFVLFLSRCAPTKPFSPFIPEPRVRIDVDNTTEVVGKIIDLGIDCKAGKKVEVRAEISGGPKGDSVTVEAYCGLAQVANTVVIVPQDNWADFNFDRGKQTEGKQAGCKVTPIFNNPGNPSAFSAYCIFE